MIDNKYSLREQLKIKSEGKNVKVFEVH